MSAIGATANTSYLDSSDKSTTTADVNCTSPTPVEKIARATGGEILVDEGMQSTCAGVFAAGDCCQVVSQQEQGQPERHWFQMKLWSQVRISCHSLCLRVCLSCLLFSRLVGYVGFSQLKEKEGLEVKDSSHLLPSFYIIPPLIYIQSSLSFLQLR